MEPKLHGAQLPYESDPFEPGNSFYVLFRRRGYSTYLWGVSQVYICYSFFFWVEKGDAVRVL